MKQTLEQFLDELKAIPLFDNHGDLPEGARLYDTERDARSALSRLEPPEEDIFSNSPDIKRSADYTRGVIYYAATEAAEKAGLISWDDVRNAVNHTVATMQYDADDFDNHLACDAALYYYITTVCADRGLDPKYVNYVTTNMSVWTAGYGLAGEYEGIRCCYKRTLNSIAKSPVLLDYIRDYKDSIGAGTLPQGAKVFDTLEEAKAAFDAVKPEVHEPDYDLYCTIDAVLELFSKAAYTAINDAMCNEMHDFYKELDATLHYILTCEDDGKKIPTELADYINDRHAAIAAGYNILDSLNHVLYVYKSK